MPLLQCLLRLRFHGSPVSSVLGGEEMGLHFGGNLMRGYAYSQPRLRFRKGVSARRGRNGGYLACWLR